MKKIVLIIICLSIPFIWSACNKDDGTDRTINLFSIDDDIELGKQLEAEIAANPADYPLLDSAQYPVAYGHLYRIRDSILKSDAVNHKDDFEWNIKIIHDDTTLNAFAAPGGYIYVYTGLIKFLDSEHELAGVMGHEIAHADRRHSTDQLTKIYGLQFMLDIVLGNESDISAILGGLIGLKFSRSNEEEADEYSVIYMCPTHYKADGAAGFFQKLGQSGTPTFLSTHPDPGNRVMDISDKATYLGCGGNETFDARYLAFKNSLP